MDKIDERDVMFARYYLIPGTKEYVEYYEKYPEKKKIDDRLKEKPGILSELSKFYNLYAFAAARGNFATIDYLVPGIDNEPSKEKKEINPETFTSFIKNWAKRLGAFDIGITELQDYHFYSVKGRGQLYGKPVEKKHRYAIAILVEMREDFTSCAPIAPVIMESTNQYLNSAVIAIQVGEVIRSLGYPAKAHIDGNYDVICPIVAKDAGLGEIGRMSLLMHPKLGPRVRIAVVTTDIPLITDSRFSDPSMINFCKKCKKCAINCPAQAIPDGEPKDSEKLWQINIESCFSYWCSSGTDCGKCLAACPYSHKNNWLHNFVRYIIHHFPFIHPFAVWVDDLFYGRKTTGKPLPDWLNK